MITKAGALGTPNVLCDGVRALQDIAAAHAPDHGQDKPLIAVTVGDVCGVGPEIILKVVFTLTWQSTLVVDLGVCVWVLCNFSYLSPSLSLSLSLRSLFRLCELICLWPQNLRYVSL